MDKDPMSIAFLNFLKQFFKKSDGWRPYVHLFFKNKIKWLNFKSNVIRRK